MSLDIAAVMEELGSKGFATSTGTLREVEFSIYLDQARYSLQRYSEDRTIHRLRPYSLDAAPHRSMSSVFGLGAQPLHSDGAHLPDPPDVVVLHAALPSPTGTAIWKPSFGASAAIPEFVRTGVFTVTGSSTPFLASAWEQQKFRFDPVAMRPGDAFAREAAEWFQSRRTDAQVQAWEFENQLLFIDNRRLLHAREAVVEGDEDRELGRLSFNLVEEAT